MESLRASVNSMPEPVGHNGPWGGWWVVAGGVWKWPWKMKKPAGLLAIFSIVRYLMSLGNLMTIITVLFFGVLRLGNQMSRRAFIDDLFLGCTWPCTWWTRKISHDFHQNVGTWWKIRRGNHVFLFRKRSERMGHFPGKKQIQQLQRRTHPSRCFQSGTLLFFWRGCAAYVATSRSVAEGDTVTRWLQMALLWCL